MLGAGVEFAFTLRQAAIQLHGLRHAGTYTFTIAPAGVSFSETLDAKIRQNIHLIKVGLNFRWDCPVIARY